MLDIHYSFQMIACWDFASVDERCPITLFCQKVQLFQQEMMVSNVSSLDWLKAIELFVRNGVRRSALSPLEYNWHTFP